MTNASEQRWHILAVKKSCKNGKFLLSIGMDDDKSKCPPRALSKEQLGRLQEKLLGRKTNCLRKLVGFSFPKYSQDPGADLKKYIA